MQSLMSLVFSKHRNGFVRDSTTLLIVIPSMCMLVCFSLHGQT